MPKEQIPPTNNQLVQQIAHQDNSISEIQSQAHREANTAVTKAMAVYWSWMVAGLLPTKQETPETTTTSSLFGNQD
jgi:hypothetical protein